MVKPKIYLFITIIILVIIVIKVQYYFKIFEEFGKYGFTCNQCDGCNPGEERVNCGGTDEGDCQACPVGYAGTGGICSQCDDGKEPSDDLTSCQECSWISAGTDGTCAPCPPGTKPTGGYIGYWNRTGGTNCTRCPGITAGTGGTCQYWCGGGFIPNPEKTACINDPNF